MLDSTNEQFYNVVVDNDDRTPATCCTFLGNSWRIPQSTISIFPKHKHANKSNFGKPEIPELEINTELQKSICHHFKRQYLPQKIRKYSQNHIFKIQRPNGFPEIKHEYLRETKHRETIPRKSLRPELGIWQTGWWKTITYEETHMDFVQMKSEFVSYQAHVGLYTFHWFSWPSSLYFKIRGLWECKIQIAYRVKGDERIEIITQIDELRRDGFWPVWLLY